MASLSVDCLPFAVNEGHNSKTTSTKDSPLLMNSERNRLKTFSTWPVQSPVQADRLAKAGFFSTGRGTEVQCFSCGLRIEEWSYNDIVMDKHRRFSPRCDFVNNTSENIPLTGQSTPTATNSTIFANSAASIVKGLMCQAQSSDENSFNRQENEKLPNVVQMKETKRESIPNGMSTNNISRSFSNGESSFSASSVPQSPPILNGSTGNLATMYQEARTLSFGNALPSCAPPVGTTGTNYGILGNSLSPVVNGTRENEMNGLHFTEPPQDVEMNGIRFSELPVPIEVRSQPTRAMGETFNTNMRYEAQRLESFTEAWPLSFLDPRELAKAGFYYLQEGDKCRCAFCRGVLMNWTEGDIPMTEHGRNFPLCPFVMELEVGNVPLKGADECGRRSMQPYKTIYSRSERNNGEKVISPVQNGTISHKGPMHPSQATLEARLRSFQSWPSWSPMKPEYLAEAGFFYIGIRDNVKCFYCDIGLCNWEPGDDAWREHGRWSKNCVYVILIKGQEFIGFCQEISEATSSNSSIEEKPSPFSAAVEEVMKSDMIQNVLKTNVFTPFLIRKALLRKFETTGKGVKSVNELSEAVMAEMEESVHRKRNLACSPVPSISCGSSSVQVVNNTSETILPLITEPQDLLENESLLEEELRKLKESRLCKVCLDREIEVVFLPCGHQVACRLCALALKDCAICRKPVTGILRTFLP